MAVAQPPVDQVKHLSGTLLQAFPDATMEINEQPGDGTSRLPARPGAGPTEASFGTCRPRATG
jgi:hypothetical protein